MSKVKISCLQCTLQHLSKQNSIYCCLRDNDPNLHYQCDQWVNAENILRLVVQFSRESSTKLRQKGWNRNWNSCFIWRIDQFALKQFDCNLSVHGSANGAWKVWNVRASRGKSITKTIAKAGWVHERTYQTRLNN